MQKNEKLFHGYALVIVEAGCYCLEIGDKKLIETKNMKDCKAHSLLILEEAFKILLKKPEDSYKLTRQSSWWKNKKKAWFHKGGGSS